MRLSLHLSQRSASAITTPMTSDTDLVELEKAIEQIIDRARDFGLSFFEMRYEVCPADIIYTFGAYAMPTRFSHWSFGKLFHKMKVQHECGLSRIYELVINSDPCYAFLLDTNSLLQNKLIASHVLAHSDFFKNNYRFRCTNRQMVHSMAAFANRVATYEKDIGRGRVERFLDAVLSIHEHVDPYPRVGPTSTSEPTRDLLLFLLDRSSDLASWQHDILSSLRDEMLYFRPQMETKIINEGWASYWHSRIMRNLDLTPNESLEFASMHADILAPNRLHLNPYHLGFYIFEDIERRYGQQKIFEVRETETDVSFIRNYLTKDLCDTLDLYLFAKCGNQWSITNKEWTHVRDGVIRQIDNCGFPYIYAEDHNYQRRNELYLRHSFEDVELDIPYLKHTLGHIYYIWNHPVHLETTEEGQRILYSYFDQHVERKLL